MSNLNSPTLSFSIPEINIFESGNQTVMKTDDSFPIKSPNIYQGSVLIKKFGVLSRTNKNAIDQIKSFEFLNDNWDGESAKAIPASVIRKSINWVHALDENNTNVYLVSPGPNQEILLMLKNCKREVELIIYDYKEKYVKFDGVDFIEQGDLDDKKISQILDWIS